MSKIISLNTTAAIGQHMIAVKLKQVGSTSETIVVGGWLEALGRVVQQHAKLLNVKLKWGTVVWICRPGFVVNILYRNNNWEQRKLSFRLEG